MQAIVIEYALQHQLEIAVLYCLTLVGSWRMITIHRPHFSQFKDISLAALPLANLLAVSLFVYQDMRQEMRRDIPSYL